MTKCLHKIKVKHVCCVKPYAVYVKLFYPKGNYVKYIVDNGRVALVEFCEQVVSTPVFVAKTIVIFVVAPKIYVAIPVFVP